MSTVPSASPSIRRRMPPEARHNQLLDVAERLFVEHTYATVSMEDIARAAEVTRPIVYRHFETKEGAYIACVKRIYERYNAALRAAIDPSATAIEQLRTGGDFYFSGIETNRDRWLLLFTSASVLTGEHARELTALRFAHVEVITDMLRAALPNAPQDVLEAAAHGISGVGEQLGHWWISRPDLDRSDLVDYYVTFLLDGLGPWVGR